MKKAAVCFCMLMVVGLALPRAASAAEDRPTTQAATNQLPAVLRDVAPTTAEIITEEEAQAVRGEWALNFAYPLLGIAIEGYGPFQFELVTLGKGLTAGRPVHVRIRIGN